jgi:hypothetical protein
MHDVMAVWPYLSALEPQLPFVGDQKAAIRVHTQAKMLAKSSSFKNSEQQVLN